MATTPKPRHCAICSRPLPPHVGRGRPRTVCRDEDSPTPGTCRRARNNGRDEARRDHRFQASLTLPGAFPGEADVLSPGATRAERLSASGFHETTLTGRAYTAQRNAHLSALYRQEQLDRYERRLAWEEWRQSWERRRACRRCPVLALGLSPAARERVARRVAGRH